MCTLHRVCISFEPRELPDKQFGTGDIAIRMIGRKVEEAGDAHLLR
jgi:hypothetical protein